MCLCAIHIKPKVSPKPIKCFKVLENKDGSYFTPFQSQKIKFVNGIARQHAARPYSIIDEDQIGACGCHACTSIKSARILESSLTDFFFVPPSPHYYLFKAEIPANTPYWEDLFGDIAATELIIYDKIITPK